MPTRSSGAKVKSTGSNTKKSFLNQVKTRAEKKTQGSARARAREIASTGSGGGAAAGNNNSPPPLPTKTTKGRTFHPKPLLPTKTTKGRTFHPQPSKTTKTPMSNGSRVKPKRVISDEERCDDLFLDIRLNFGSTDPKVLAKRIIKSGDDTTETQISDLFTTYIDNKEKEGGILTENEENLKILHHELIATQSQKAQLTEANAPNNEWGRTTKLGKINRRKTKKTKKRNNKKSSKRK